MFLAIANYNASQEMSQSQALLREQTWQVLKPDKPHNREVNTRIRSIAKRVLLCKNSFKDVIENRGYEAHFETDLTWQRTRKE
jgi:hypothetical protein